MGRRHRDSKNSLYSHCQIHRSKVTYCSEIWGSSALIQINKLQLILFAVTCVCLGYSRTISIIVMEIELNIELLGLIYQKADMAQSFKNTRLFLQTINMLFLPGVPQFFSKKIKRLAQEMPNQNLQIINIYFRKPPWKTWKSTLK